VTTRASGTITANGQTVPVLLDPNDVSGTVLLSGTHAGITLVFEVSLDNVTWNPAVAVRNDSIGIPVVSIALSANSSSVWNIQVGQFRALRIRSTAYTSGTLNVIIISDDQPVILPEEMTQAISADPTPVFTSHVFKSTAAQPLVGVKASPGMMHNLLITNTTATPTFLKLYDKASAPNPATDVPILIVPVAANVFVSVNFGSAGKRFATGIAYAYAGAVADTDTTALTAGQIYMSFDYE
jgi:hypothetical protein